MRTMIRRRAWRAAGAAIAASLSVLLAACGDLPTSGPVNAGQTVAADGADSIPVFFPDAPVKDATPQQIVEGFIAAGSGTSGNWETARMYLAPGYKDWNPREGVVVAVPGQRSLEETTTGEFTLTVTPVATVDATGVMTTESSDLQLPYSVAQQADGQWRITQAPQGIVLDRNRFTAVFGSYDLAFFDSTWTYLVPDRRWFPKQYATTMISSALVDGGPSPWLEGAVATAFTDAARLATPSVPTRSNVAAVSLQEGARALDATVLNRMQTQLQASLAQAGVDDVDMLVDDQVLAASPVAVRSTRVDSRPLVLTDTSFGFLSDEAVDELPNLGAAIAKVQPVDVETNGDRTAAAVRDAIGDVYRVQAAGAQLLDERSDLVAPSIDPEGYVWTVPAGSPAAVRAYAFDGSAVQIPDAWAGATEIVQQRVSRDGTRVAAIVRDAGGYALWVAGILRDRDGAPTGLGQRRVVSSLSGAASSLTWVDGSSLAFLTDRGDDRSLDTQPIGGFGVTQRAPGGVTTVSGGTAAGLYLLDSAGALFTQRGANWQQQSTGIHVLAVQQGAP